MKLTLNNKSGRDAQSRGTGITGHTDVLTYPNSCNPQNKIERKSFKN